VEIPLIYDAPLKRSRIDQSVVWRWKSNGALLTEQERSEIIRKAKEFMVRRHGNSKSVRMNCKERRARTREKWKSD